MKLVGLVIHMAGGAAVQVITLEPNARIIVRDWSQKISSEFIGDLTAEAPWMVKTADVQAIQIVAVNSPQNPEEANTIPKKLPPSCSGV